VTVLTKTLIINKY